MQTESFIDFLYAYGAAYSPSMVHRKGEDFAEWQARFRKKLGTLRGPLPERVEPKMEVVDAVDLEGYTRYLVRIPVSAFSTLVAYLLVPHGISRGEQRPGLIVSHGHAQYGIDSVCGVQGVDEGDNARRAYGLFAVRAGYVVLAPAWWGWRGRDGHLDRVGQRGRCNVIQMAAAMYGMNVIDLHIQDGQAALDVLAARPEVDANRLGCIGNSYGGRTTMWLSVFDDRVKACVSAGCMNTFRERSLKLSSCGIQYLPGILQYGDVPELFTLIAPRSMQLQAGEGDSLITPRSMQLQAGEGDSLITPADRDAMEAKVRGAYRLLGAETNFDYVLHPDGHLLRWDLAVPFLERYL